MGMSVEILLVERDDADARRVQRLIQRSGERFSVDRVVHLPEAKQRLTNHRFDAVLLDPDEPAAGSTAVSQLHTHDQNAAIVVLARPGHDWVAAEAIRHGAQALVHTERLDGEDLGDTIDQAIARQRYRRVTAQAGASASKTADGLRQVIESLPLGVIVYGQDGVLLMNSAAARIVRATGHGPWKNGPSHVSGSMSGARIVLDQRAYGLHVHDRSTHWRGRSMRMMLLQLKEVEDQPMVSARQDDVTALRSGIECLHARHRRLRDLWRALCPRVRALVHKDSGLRELVEEYDGTRDAVESMLQSFLESRSLSMAGLDS